VSRSIAEFVAADANLYFRGTYCLDTSNDRIVMIRECAGDQIHVQAGTDNYFLTPEELAQWWPQSRGTNIMLANRNNGVLVVRTARRHVRRSICPQSSSLYWLRGTKMVRKQQLDINTANALYKKTSYVNLSIGALKKFIEDLDQSPFSVCVGRRLFYKPLWNDLVGQLFYSHLGMLGVVDLTTGSYKAVATQSRLAKRAQYTLEKFLCQD
jgi:hypothetical protein